MRSWRRRADQVRPLSGLRMRTILSRNHPRTGTAPDGAMTTTDIAKPAPPRRLAAALTGNGQLALLAVLAVLCIAISAAAPQFYSTANVIAILRQCALVLIVASGMTMLLISAEVDLSVG